jgi:hypothetical protein
MAIENILHGLQCTAVWLTDGPKRVFSNVNPMSDALRLTQRVSEIAKAIFSYSPIEYVAKALGNITDFIGARSIIGRVADLVSPQGAWSNPFWIGNKFSSLIGDISSTVKWMASINVFGESLSSAIRNATGQFVSWGNPFNLLKGVGDFSCITSSLFDIADIARKAFDEFHNGGYLQDGAFKAKTAGSHFCGMVWFVAKVSGCILSNIPGVHVVCSAVAGAVGALSSLGKFYVEQYLKDPNGGNGPAGAAQAPVDRQEPVPAALLAEAVRV